MSPRLLDLFCGAGGAAMGYSRAGFDVIGVDNNPDVGKRYPFHFEWNDALHYLALYSRYFDAIHASPPCQRYSLMSNCRPDLAASYPDLIGPTRELLDEIGKPYVIENVPGAPLRNDAVLCGQMFGLDLYRHRVFEANWPVAALAHPEHVKPGSKAGHWAPGTVISVSGHCSPMRLAREAMGIDWMTRDELTESIPPAFTEHIGKQLHAVTCEVAA